MARELRGSRYLTKANEPLKDFILGDLPYLDFWQTMDWYEAIEPTLDDKGRALLNANDRYYLLTHTLNRPDAIHPWLFERCREVEADPDGHLDLWARYHYKAECLNTPTLTPDGWRTHGDLGVGDEVFGPDGKPTKIVGRTPVYFNADCYRVTFDKGEQITVSGDHLWTVDVQHRARTEDGGRTKRTTVTINTRALAKKVEHARLVGSAVLPSVAVSAPINYYHSADVLPLHPYIVGVWLGDGATHAAVISNHIDDDAIIRRIESLGYRTRRRPDGTAVGVYAILPALRSCGLLGNKHIPGIYARASIEARFELLRGLMDTDGHCDTRGTATFTSAKEILARDVFDLAAGLGLKPSLRRHVGRYKDAPYPFWNVGFQVVECDEPVFYLERKQARASRAPRTRSARHAIVAVDPVESVPVRCIQVDRPDGLYLTGRHLVTTHNSTIGTFAGLIQEIIVDPEITIAILSCTDDVATPFLTQIQQELESNEDLKRIHADVFWKNPRKEAPLWSRQEGIVVKRRGNPKEATVEAHGVVDAMPTGKHFRLLDYDDLVTEKLVTNPEMIKKVTERWELSDNLGSSHGTRKWHWGTRYSFGDSYGIILERQVLRERRHPATVDGTLKGEPVLLSDARWNEVKAAQRSTVAAQMLLNPLAGNEATFSTLSFRHYDLIPAVLNVYILVDPSKGKTRRSDRTAIAVVGIDTAGNKYLLDGYCHRMKLSQRWQFIKQLEAKWRLHPGVQLCRVGYEQYGMQVDLEVIEEYQVREDNHFQIEELNTTRDGTYSKKDRIERLEPDLTRGIFYLPATVYHPDYGGGHQNQALWDVWSEDDFAKFDAAGTKNNPAVGTIIYRPMAGQTRNMRYAEATSQTARIVTALRRRNEEGDIYDLTRVFMEEARFHPFAPHDDLIDAVSRIYDMEPKAPVQFEAMSTEPTAHPDS